MLADLCKSAILLGDNFLWYRRFRRSGGVFRLGWILSQARWIGIVFHRQNGDLSFFFYLWDSFELWKTWNLLCQFLGLNVAVLDVDQRVIDFCWTT